MQQDMWSERQKHKTGTSIPTPSLRMLNAKRLINELAIKRDSKRTEKESRVFIGGCGCVECDMATRDHFDWVPVAK